MSHRKLFPIVFISLIFCIILFVLYILISNNRQSQEEYKSNLKQSNYQNNYVELIKQLKNNYKDIYAGGYLDDESYFNANFIEGANTEDIEELKSNKVRIHYVKFSLIELERIIEALNKIIKDLGIAAVELDEKENKVYVYFENMDDTKINKVKGIIDSPAIEFREQTLKIQY